MNNELLAQWAAEAEEVRQAKELKSLADASAGIRASQERWSARLKALRREEEDKASAQTMKEVGTFIGICVLVVVFITGLATIVGGL